MTKTYPFRAEIRGHRLWLERKMEPPLGQPLECIAWIMLNPSTADADHDDPTIKSVIRISRHNGYSRVLVGNLFTRRATDPSKLIIVPGGNCAKANEVLRWICSEASAVIAAWGRAARVRPQAEFKLRKEQVLDMLKSMELPVFTLGNSPYHPLYKPTKVKLKRMM